MKALKKQTETTEKHGKKQSLESSAKESPSIKNFTPERMLYPEVVNDVKTLEHKNKELTKQICFTSDTKLSMILQSLKLYGALKMILGIV